MHGAHSGILFSRHLSKHYGIIPHTRALCYHAFVDEHFGFYVMCVTFDMMLQLKARDNLQRGAVTSESFQLQPSSLSIHAFKSR